MVVLSLRSLYRKVKFFNGQLRQLVVVVERLLPLLFLFQEED